MTLKMIAGFGAAGFALGVISTAWAAGAPQAKVARIAMAQPSGPAEGEVPNSGDLPPARPKVGKKRKFFAGPGLGLLVAAAGAGTAAAVSSGDSNPTSP